MPRGATGAYFAVTAGMRRALIVAALFSTFAFSGCRANVGGQEQSPERARDALNARRTSAPLAPPAPASAPDASARKPVAPRSHAENDLDRAVHLELDRAFSLDPTFKDQNIRVVVHAGEVTLTGTVKAEKEREKANEVAMNVPGVRSVANALRVSE